MHLLLLSLLLAPLGSLPLTAPDAGAPPGSDLAALGHDDAQWVMATKDYANTRFSGLNQVTAANVAGLKLAWTFTTGIAKGHEAAPLVVGDTMYVVTPFPNHLHALDLGKQGAEKWVFKPDPVQLASQGVACCDVVNRGAAWFEGKVIYNTLDGTTVAVDARTGKQAWRTKVADINKGETITMAPMVAKGKVFVGNSGGEFGVRGWLVALDASTGKEAWRAYTTGPDKEVLIGPNFKPYYPQDKGQDLGVKTWPPNRWQIGGGTVWGFLAYDPELDLLYYGTGNPGPWSPDMRPGDNKWTCGVFARRPETGEAIWYYQWSPHDLYDHDGINEMVLVDLPIGGKPRKALLHPGRNGFMYVLDRTSGQVLSATSYVVNNAAKGVDLQSGKLIPNDEKKPVMGRVVRDVCPAAPGAKDWQPSAFSPQTNLLYVPHQNLCEDIETTEANYIEGTPFVGANVRYYVAPGMPGGTVDAWDPVAAKKVWSAAERWPVWSGALATAGGLVFYGTMDGYFKALDARTGKELWKHKTASGIISQPMTFKGPDGKQYVAVLDGIGGWPGSIVVANLDTRDQTAGNGWGEAMRELPKVTGPGGTLYVFALP